MDNISKIMQRLTMKFMKERTILILISVQNIVLALIVLIFSNIIISNANISGELDYFQIGIFNNICILLLFLSIYVTVPIFIGGIYGELCTTNVVEHLLAVKITNSDILTAILIRGLINSFIIFMTACPITLMSFYFMGDGALKIIKIVIFLVSFLCLYSVITLHISTRFNNSNISIFVSYLIGVFLFIFYIYIQNLVLNNLRIYLFYLIFIVIVSIIVFAFTRKNGQIL